MKTKVKLKDINDIDYISYIRPHLESGYAAVIKKEKFNEQLVFKRLSNKKTFIEFYVSRSNKLNKVIQSKSDAKRKALDIIKKGSFYATPIEIKVGRNGEKWVLGVFYEFSKSQRLYDLFEL